MKTEIKSGKISLFREKRVIFEKMDTVNVGVEATKEMSPHPSRIPDDLRMYFDTVKKGEYFSITKREQIKGNDTAKKGVTGLQKFLAENDIYNKTKNELKDKNSPFRRKLESTMAIGTDRSLFYLSLKEFDRGGTLDKRVDGIYGDSTRLAVAFIQFNNGLTVDGAFGKATLDVLDREKGSEERQPVRAETTARLEELKNKIKRDAVTAGVVTIAVDPP